MRMKKEIVHLRIFTKIPKDGYEVTLACGWIYEAFPIENERHYADNLEDAARHLTNDFYTQGKYNLCPICFKQKELLELAAINL